MHKKSGSPTGAPNHFHQDVRVLPAHQAHRHGARVLPHPLLAQRASAKFVRASVMKALAAMVKIANSCMKSLPIEANPRPRAEVLRPMVPTDPTHRLRSTHDLTTAAAVVAVVAPQVPLPETTPRAIIILPKTMEDKAVNMVAPIKTAIIGGAAPLAAEIHID